MEEETSEQLATLLQNMEYVEAAKIQRVCMNKNPNVGYLTQKFSDIDILNVICWSFLREEA